MTQRGISAIKLHLRSRQLLSQAIFRSKPRNFDMLIPQLGTCFVAESREFEQKGVHNEEWHAGVWLS